MIASGLWIILLESLLALALLIFIVWWTMPRSKRSDQAPSTEAKGPSGRDSDQPRS